MRVVGLFNSSANSASYTPSGNPTTDFTFSASVTAGRPYVLGFHARWTGSAVTDLNFTDGTITRTFGRLRGEMSPHTSGPVQYLYIPTTSGSKTFTVSLALRSGSGAIQFVASALAQRQFWLRDLGPYPIAGNALGLVGYAEATTPFTALTTWTLDNLPLNLTILAGAVYAICYSSDLSTGTCTSYVWNGTFNEALFLNLSPSMPANHFSGRLLYVPTADATRLFVLRHGASATGATFGGTTAYPRQFWVERVG